MAMYALKSRLSGGASMYESLMGILALVSLDPYAYLNNETTYTKRSPLPLDALGKTRSLNALRAHREDMLARLSKLRGPLRSELFEALNMQEGYSFLGATTRGSSLTARAGCGKAQTTSSYLSEAQSAISSACTLGTVITSNPASNLLKLGSGLQTFANAPFFRTAFGAGESDG